MKADMVLQISVDLLRKPEPVGTVERLFGAGAGVRPSIRIDAAPSG